MKPSFVPTVVPSRFPLTVFFCLLGLGMGRVLGAPTASDDTSVLVLKHLSLEELLNVEVTSVSRFSEGMMNAATSIQVIHGEDIVRSAARTLPEALRLADNLDVAQKNPHDWAISARGFNANVGDKMLVLIDGRTVYTPLFAGVFWNAQDYLLQDIDRIEVISGPGGTLWGANAVNGVINVTTKSAKDTQGGYFSAAAGAPWNDQIEGRYGGQIAPNIYYRVYGKYFEQPDGVLESGAKAHDGWRQGQGGFRVDALPRDDITYTLQGDFYSGDLEMQTGRTARLAGGNLLGRWARNLGGDGGMQLQVYVDRTHLADPIVQTPYAPAGYLRTDTDTYDLDFQHTLRLADRHRFVWGFGYRVIEDREKAAPSMVFLPAHDTQNRFNVYAQDEFALTDQLALIAGTKFEHNGYTGWEVEPNVRARWNFTPKQMAWAAVSRAVRMPAKFDRGLAEPAPPYNLILGGSSSFRSETLIAYELGYRAQLGAKAGLSVTTFYHDYDDLRGLQTTPVTVLPLTYHNTTKGHSYGVEFSADYQVMPAWRLHAGYDLLRERLELKPGHNDFFGTLDETEDPEHQTFVRSAVDLPHGVHWDTEARWISRLTVNSGGRPAYVPAYTEVDTRIGWRMRTDTELSIGGQNLLDAHHAEYGAPSPAREQIRRTVYAKLEWFF